MITRVWGKADRFEIEFVYQDGRWDFRGLPPDLDDGQYAVELHAAKDSGSVGHWTGILYMMQGVASLCICRSGSRLDLIPGSSTLTAARPVVVGRCGCDR